MALNKTNSRFIKVRCEGCKNEQVIFNKSASKVKCLVCSKTLSKTTGGKSNIKAKALKSMD